MHTQTAAKPSDTDDPSVIPPLTYLGYTRSERTEADIVRTLPLKGAAIAAAFVEHDVDLPAYRTTEALIFFLRRALSRSDHTVVRLLFRQLYDRCQIYFRSAIRGVRDADAQMDVRQEVLRRLTELLFRQDETADFLEARFWVYMRKRVASECALLAKRRRRETLASETLDDEDDNALTILDAVADSRLGADDAYDLQAALASLPPDLRELFVLKHMEEWQIDNTRGSGADCSGPTLAELYGISPRAVHKRLAKAERLLASFRREVE